MADRLRSVDEHPGTPPDVQTDQRGVTYRFTRGPRKATYLVIRCDEEGQIWISIPSHSEKPAV